MLYKFIVNHLALYEDLTDISLFIDCSPERKSTFLLVGLDKIG